MTRKNLSRLVLRGLLLASALASIGVLVASIVDSSWFADTGVVVAAALAVLAALLSGWTSLRVLELQEDLQDPMVCAEIDSRSRYSLTQFKLRNDGGSPAFNVAIDWEVPLTTVEGETIEVGRHSTAFALPVLNPRQEFSILLGASHRFYAENKSTEASGWIKFMTASGDSRKEHFQVSGEHERRAMVHNEEEPKTMYELQKIPKELDKVSREIASLRETLKSSESKV